MKIDKIAIILGALLFLSLSGNMFMAGLMLGHSVNAGGGKPERDAEWKQRDEQLQKKLSPADRAVVEAAKRKARPKIDALRKALNDAQARLAAAQAAEPYDQSAIDAAVKAEADAKAEILKAMRQARQDVMEQLSPEGRETVKSLAPWKKLNGHPGKRRDFDAPPQGDLPPRERPPETYGQSPAQSGDVAPESAVGAPEAAPAQPSPAPEARPDAAETPAQP